MNFFIEEKCPPNITKWQFKIDLNSVLYGVIVAHEKYIHFIGWTFVLSRIFSDGISVGGVKFDLMATRYSSNSQNNFSLNEKFGIWFQVKTFWWQFVWSHLCEKISYSRVERKKKFYGCQQAKKKRLQHQFIWIVFYFISILAL